GGGGHEGRGGADHDGHRGAGDRQLRDGRGRRLRRRDLVAVLGLLPGDFALVGVLAVVDDVGDGELVAGGGEGHGLRLAGGDGLDDFVAFTRDEGEGGLG